MSWYSPREAEGYGYAVLLKIQMDETYVYHIEIENPMQSEQRRSLAATHHRLRGDEERYTATNPTVVEKRVLMVTDRFVRLITAKIIIAGEITLKVTRKESAMISSMTSNGRVLTFRSEAAGHAISVLATRAVGAARLLHMLQEMIKGDQRDARRQAIQWDMEDLVATATNMSGGDSKSGASSDNNSISRNVMSGRGGTHGGTHGDTHGGMHGGTQGGRKGGEMKVSFQQMQGETKETKETKDRDHRRGRSATAPLVLQLSSTSSNLPLSPVRKSVVLRAKELVRRRRICPLDAVIVDARTNVVRSNRGRKSSHTLYRVTLRGVMEGSDETTYRVMWDVERRYSDFVRLRDILMTTLQSKDDQQSLSDLPSKRMRSLVRSVVTERQSGLQIFLKDCLKHSFVSKNELLIGFLSTDNQRVRVSEITGETGGVEMIRGVE